MSDFEYFSEYDPLVIAGREVKSAIGKAVPELDECRKEAFARVSGEELQQKGGKYGYLTREACMLIADITEADLVSAPAEARHAFDKAVAEVEDRTRKEKMLHQRKISCNDLEWNAISRCAERFDMSESNFMVRVSHTLALIHEVFDSYSELQKSLWEMILFRPAYTSEEVTQAMDKAGISPSQAVKLMAELERMRNARMNPDSSGNTLPE